MLRKFLAVGFLLFATQAEAASRVWISEFGVLGTTNSTGPAQIASLPSITNQSTLDISGGVQSSSAFNPGTRYIRVICEVQCSVKVGGTASTSDMLMPALSPEYFGVQPGAVLSVIASP